MSPVYVEGFGGGVPDHRSPVSRDLTEYRGDSFPEPGRLPEAAGSDITSQLRHLSLEAARALRVSRVGIWKLEDGQEGLRGLIRFDRSQGSLAEDLVFGPELGRSFRVLLDGGAAVSVNDTLLSRGVAPAFDEWVASQGIRAILIQPVRSEGSLTGLLTFEESRSPREWTSREQDLAAEVARRVGDTLTDRPRRVVSGVEAPEAETSLDPRARPHPSRGSLRAVLRRLPPVEVAAILASERVDELLRALEVQAGYLGLLREAVTDDAEELDLVSEARSSGDRVREGLAEFLRHLRQGVRRSRAADLNLTLGATVPALAREAGDGVRLRIAPSADPIPVEIDQGLLERALVHLVRNAREASPSGGDVRLSWCRVPSEKGADEPDLARVRVEDRGEGIPESNLPWLFEPFFSTRTGDRPLQGLGLSVVQAVVEGHGGWVEVSSRVGEGTRVDLFFPVATAPTKPVSARPPLALDAALPLDTRDQPAPERVLVLEDEPFLARLIERTLTRNGYVVEVAAAPVEAERRLRRMGGADVVVAERSLGGGRSGVDAVQRWRRDMPGLRMVVLDRQAPPGTASVHGEEDPVLTRPFEPADVLTCVRDVIARASGRAPSAPVTGTGGGSSIAH